MPTTATHVWRPSSARTVALDGFVPVPRGAQIAPPPPLTWPAKDPADVLDYLLDVSAAFIGNDGDSIATLDVATAPAKPGDLVVQRTVADGGVAVLWLGGGQAGTLYTVTISVGTTSGRAIVRSVLLPVVALSTVPVPLNGLTTENGLVLTDQNGNPILLGG